METWIKERIICIELTRKFTNEMLSPKMKRSDPFGGNST